jgi:hypothetical protein
MANNITKFLRAREQSFLSGTGARPAPASQAASATGPKTPEGKAISSMNALKHGLTSTKIVLPGEDPAEFVSFRDRLVSEQAPVGELETQLAHELAGALWRLRRIRAYETKLLENADAIFSGADAGAGKGFDRLLRYMGSAERHVDRVQRQLERAQKERRKLEADQRLRADRRGENRPPQFVSSKPVKAARAAAGFVSSGSATLDSALEGVAHLTGSLH